MLLKIRLSLRRDRSSYIPLPRFLELIKNDEILTTTTKAMLEGMKKAHQNYVPIPLQHDVIISSERYVILHKDISPPAKVWTCNYWSDNNKKMFEFNEKIFLSDILLVYEKMGYDYTISTCTVEEVEDIMVQIEKLKNKTLKKIERLKARHV